MFEDDNDVLSIFLKIRQYLSVRLVTQLAIFFCGLVISGFGLFQLFNSTAQASQIMTEDDSESSNGFAGDSDESIQVCEKDPEFGRLTVDIGGAIKNPGVYELEVGSRVNDLISIAGGFSSAVDKHHINKILNLSTRLNDGEKFYIPTIEESIEAQQKQFNSGSHNADNNDSSNVVSINSASKSELTSLTGIGEKRAEDIVAERPYDSLYKLVEKGVITESIFEGIKNNVSL